MTIVREELSNLEKSGKYLFHGSGYKLDTLDPQQAYNLETNERAVADDQPGIHATPDPDVAIFMAIISEPNTPQGFRSSFVYNDNKITFGATQNTLDQIRKGARGYVYVLDAKDFKERTRLEYIAYKSVQAIRVIEVTGKDLPKDIKVID